MLDKCLADNAPLITDPAVEKGSGISILPRAAALALRLGLF